MLNLPEGGFIGVLIGVLSIIFDEDADDDIDDEIEDIRPESSVLPFTNAKSGYKISFPFITNDKIYMILKLPTAIQCSIIF